MSVNTHTKVAWVEVAATDALNFPLAAMSRRKIYKWMLAVCDLRCTGTFDKPGGGSASFDFRLSEVTDSGAIQKYQPTEFTHLQLPGLSFLASLNSGGALTTGDDGVATVIVGVGRATSLIAGNDSQPVVRYDGGDLFLSFGASLSCPFSGSTGVLGRTYPSPPDAPGSPVACTFNGESVPMFGVDGFDGAGALHIALPATGGWLTFGGRRSADTGHFTTSSV